jgi:hypothetical protein
VGRRTFTVEGRERAEWVGYIRRTPKVALPVANDTHAQHTRVNVQGLAEIAQGPTAPPDNPRLNELVERMSIRYLGENEPAYAELTAGPPPRGNPHHPDALADMDGWRVATMVSVRVRPPWPTRQENGLRATSRPVPAHIYYPR